MINNTVVVHVALANPMSRIGYDLLYEPPLSYTRIGADRRRTQLSSPSADKFHDTPTGGEPSEHGKSSQRTNHEDRRYRSAT